MSKIFFIAEEISCVKLLMSKQYINNNTSYRKLLLYNIVSVFGNTSNTTFLKFSIIYPLCNFFLILYMIEYNKENLI